jgi:hypothetical protein
MTRWQDIVETALVASLDTAKRDTAVSLFVVGRGPNSIAGYVED